MIWIWFGLNELGWIALVICVWFALYQLSWKGVGLLMSLHKRLDRRRESL